MEQQTNKRDKPLLVIGNKNYSSWSLRAWLMLRHAGIDFEEMRIPLATPGCDLKLLYFSPAGKVPVYRKGDMVVWDSLAIAEHLYEQYPALWPADPAARAHARSISAEMHAGFSALRTAMPMNIRARDRKVERTPGVEADIARICNIWRDLRTQYLAQGPWLFGAYSIADAMFAPVVFRFRTYGVREAGLIEEYMGTVLHDPLIQDWIQSSQREQEVIVAYETGIHHGWHIADT